MGTHTRFPTVVSLALFCSLLPLVPSASDTDPRITQITFGPSRDWFPSVSANGEWVVFESDRENEGENDNFDLWRIELPTGNLNRVTRNQHVHMHDQSPLGDRIVFDSSPAGLMILDSASPEEIQRLVPGGRPAWSSDGGEIYYHAEMDTGSPSHELRAIELKSGRIRTIFTSDEGYLTPTISPDGRVVVFSMGSWGERNLWIISTDGSGLKQLTNEPGNECLPVFSPDGTKVAYYADGGGNRDIWVKPVNGGAAVRVTSHKAADISPDWFPDGKRIIFASDRSGKFKLYSLRLEQQD